MEVFTVEKPIPFDSVYVMKPGMTYLDVCRGMRLDESEIPAGIKALELLNGPELKENIGGKNECY